jgi:hypothetical protein
MAKAKERVNKRSIPRLQAHFCESATAVTSPSRRNGRSYDRCVVDRPRANLVMRLLKLGFRFRRCAAPRNDRRYSVAPGDAAFGGMRRHPRDRNQERRRLQPDAGQPPERSPFCPRRAGDRTRPWMTIEECDVRNSGRMRPTQQNAREPFCGCVRREGDQNRKCRNATPALPTESWPAPRGGECPCSCRRRGTRNSP